MQEKNNRSSPADLQLFEYENRPPGEIIGNRYPVVSDPYSFITIYTLLFTNYRPPNTEHRPLTTEYRSPITNYPGSNIVKNIPGIVFMIEPGDALLFSQPGKLALGKTAGVLFYFGYGEFQAAPAFEIFE